MCNNRSAEERKKYDLLGQYAALVLQGKSLEEVAEIMHQSVDEVKERFEAIKPINPYLYRQVTEKVNL